VFSVQTEGDPAAWNGIKVLQTQHLKFCRSTESTVHNNTSASVKEWCKSPHGITGPPGQSSRNSGNKCQLPTPLTMPNFIMLGQTLYEKALQFFYTIPYFGAPGDPHAPKFTNLGDNVYQFSFIKLKTLVRDIDLCCQSSSISLMLWPTHKKSKRYSLRITMRWLKRQ